MRIRRRLAPTLLVATLSLGIVAGAAEAAPAGAAADYQSDSLASQARSALDLLNWVSVTGDGPALEWYARQRDALATDVAIRYGVDASTLQAAWNATDLQHQTALMAALSQIGVRYRRNSSSPGVAFDCSGLTSYAWGRAGVSIDHQSHRQINAAAPRTQDTAEPGDIVYYPGHVMMYVGAGLMVHAPYPGKSVEIDDLPRHRLRFGNPA